MMPSLETFFSETVLAASRDAAVLALAVGVVLIISGSRIPPFWRHGLWLLVAVRLALPVLPGSSFSWKNWMLPAPSVSAPAAQVVAAPNEPTGPNKATISPEGTPTADLALVGQLTPNSKPKTGVGPTHLRTVDWRTVGAALWGLGFLAIVVLGLVRAYRFRRVVQRLTVEERDSSRIVDLLGQLARVRKLNRAPRVTITAAVDSPAVSGLLKPEILLPPGLASELTDAELRLVLRHELAHLRRRDIWINWGLLVLQALHWFNPFVWWAFRRARIEAERATDDVVMQEIGAAESSSYGQTLLRLLRRASQETASGSPVPGVVGIAENWRDLRARFALIGKFSGKRRHLATAASVLLLAALAMVGLTEPKAAEKAGEARDDSKTGTNLRVIEVRDAQGTLVAVEQLIGVNVRPNDEKTKSFFAKELQNEAADPKSQFAIRHSMNHAPPGSTIRGLVLPSGNRPPLFAAGKLPNLQTETIQLQSQETLREPETRLLDTLPDFEPQDLTGRVVDRQGRPVAGAKVSAQRSVKLRQRTITTTTDDDGLFRIPDFYTISDGPGTGLKVEREGIGVAWIVDIPVGKPFELTFESSARFRGKLDQPGPGTIRFSKSKPSRFNGIGYKARDLNHSIEIAPDGSYDVAIEPGLYEVRIHTANTSAVHQGIRVKENQTVALPAKTVPMAQLILNAVDRETGLPVAGVKFHFQAWNAPMAEGTQRETDQSGRAAWDKLQSGATVLAFRRGEWMRIFANDPMVKSDRDDRGWFAGFYGLNLDLKPGENQLTVELERGVEITGNVMTPEGKGLAGALVHLSDAVTGSTITGDDRFGALAIELGFGDGPDLPARFKDGYFTTWIPASAAGTEYRFTARDYRGKYDDRRTGEDRNERWAEAVSDRFKAKPGERLDFQLKLTAGRRASGRVVDPQGRPVAGIEVQAENQDVRSSPYAHAYVLTNERGEFKFSALREGTYRFYPDTVYGTNRDGSHAGKEAEVGGETEATVGDLIYDGPDPIPDPDDVRMEGKKAR